MQRTIIVCPMQCIAYWTEYKITLTCPVQCPSHGHGLWTRLWRYLWTDLYQIFSIAFPYYTEDKIF